MSDSRGLGMLVGAVAGFFTGGIGYVAMGASIGGAIGGLLAPKERVDVNKIDDITVSVSKYGDGIPETYGNGRPPLTWVWSTYIIQIGEEQSGKGGGTVQTTYRQFIHGLLCLGKTPPPGSTVTIRKLWIDGKLNYDASSGLSAGQALATEENPFQSLLIFDGNDAQLPIAIIEAYEGIGNVPAFRGRLTAFVFGLECPGGRVPQIQVEVCINAGRTTEQMLFADFGAPMPGWAGSESVWSFNAASGEYRGDIARASAGTAVKVQTASASSNSYSPFDNYQEPYPVSGALTPESVYLYGAYDGGLVTRPINLNILNMETGESRLLLTQEAGDAFASHVIGRGYRPVAAYDPVTDAYAIKSDYSSYPTRIDVIRAGAIVSTNDTLPEFYSQIAFYGGYVYVLVTNGLVPRVLKLDADTGAQTAQFDGPSIVGFDLTRSAIHASDLGVAVYAHGTQPQLILFDADIGTYAVRAAEADLVGGETPVGIYIGTQLYYRTGFAIVGPSTSGKWTMLRLDAIAPSPADVAGFIESQVLRTGLSTESLDVSAVDDSFWGLTIKGPSSARDRIASAMNYSALGIVEEDGLLRFFPRADKASVVTIAYDELGFVEDGSEPGDTFPVVHTNAQELPSSLTLSYNDPDFDYQTSTAKAIFPSATWTSDANESLDMNIDGDRAASIARRMLLERWMAQNTRTCTVSRRYAYLSAGDVVTVEYPRGVLSEWMTSKIADTGARVEIECFPSDNDLIIQTVPGPGGFQAQQIQPLAPPTLTVPLNTPILRDADDNAGLYFALSGYGPAYPGGELFTGPDDGSLSSRGTVQGEAVVGLAETVLGPWARNVVDETSLLTVNVNHHALGTITRAILLAGASNVAAVGADGRWEILAFQRADDLGGGRYILPATDSCCLAPPACFGRISMSAASGSSRCTAPSPWGAASSRPRRSRSPMPARA
jgi:hypothetical protein